MGIIPSRTLPENYCINALTRGLIASAQIWYPAQIRMQAVGHDLRRERAVGVRNLSPMSMKNTCLLSASFASLPLISLIARGADCVGSTARGKIAEDQHLRLRLALLEFLDDEAVAVGDLVVRIAVDVVGAEHQHDQLRLEAVQFAVLHAPQHALRGVAADAEVGRLQRREVLSQTSRPRFRQPSVIESPTKSRSMFARARDLEKAFVARRVAGILEGTVAG